MSAPIEAGMWVECIGDWPHAGLSRGSLWLCEDVLPPCDASCAQCGQDLPALVLRGFVEPVWADPADWAPGLCPCGFRPVYRPKSDLIKQLQTPAPKRELHDA